MRVAIMGSGGVGAYVGAWLQTAGQDVTFIARGAHLAALQRQGLQIEHPQLPLQLHPVRATDQPADVGVVDLVVFAVKLWDTEAAALQMAPLVGPHTRVLSLQNGIDSLALLGRQLPAAQLRGGVIYVSAVIDRPGVIRSPGGLQMIVADAAGDDPVMAALAQTADQMAGLKVKLSPDIGQTIWEKFVALAALSAATTLLRARMGAILAHPETRALQRQLIDEVVAVAVASGQPLRAGLADEVMGKLAAMPAQFRSSMAEDLERGRPLELAWLSGRVHALGQALGVPTPAHSTTYRALVLHSQGQPAEAAA